MRFAHSVGVGVVVEAQNILVLLQFWCGTRDQLCCAETSGELHDRYDRAHSYIPSLGVAQGTGNKDQLA